ncbi:MAG: FAD-dependent oxidoreductase [Variovorax sp.]|nr:MAG: FAD-dependent oxidoreductase [Variovorax sp.]
MSTQRSEKIAVVGGGITGLFCAYVLAKNGHQPVVFEATDRWGGRIRTIRLMKKDLKGIPDEANPPSPPADTGALGRRSRHQKQACGRWSNQFCHHFRKLRKPMLGVIPSPERDVMVAADRLAQRAAALGR